MVSGSSSGRHSRNHAQSARANALAALGVWDELLAMLE